MEETKNISTKKLTNSLCCSSAVSIELNDIILINGENRLLFNNKNHIIMLSIFSFLVITSVVISKTELFGYINPIFRATLGFLIFFISSGFAMFSVVSMFQGHSYTKISLFIISISISLSINCFINFLIYLFPTSSLNVVNIYQILLLIVYSCFFVRILFINETRDVVLTEIKKVNLIKLLLYLLLFAANYFLIYYKDLPQSYVEEFIIQRRLFELSQIKADNLWVVPGQITTYIFVPFHLVIAFVAHFARLEVSLIPLALWPCIGIISNLCIILLAVIITRNTLSAITIYIFIIVTTFINLQPGSVIGALVNIYPDRYSIAAMLLIPLSLFHYFVFINERKTNICMFIGLVYIITEMSFVHANETIYLVAILILFALFQFNPDVKVIFVKTMTVISLCCAILLIYKILNLYLNPRLFEFVNFMSMSFKEAIKDLYESKGMFFIFYTQTLNFYGRQTFHHYMSVHPFIYIVILFLPFYTLLAKSVYRKSIIAIIAIFGLFNYSSLLKIIIGGIVGSWHLFNVNSILGLFLLIVFADMPYTFLKKDFQEIISVSCGKERIKILIKLLIIVILLLPISFLFSHFIKYLMSWDYLIYEYFMYLWFLMILLLIIINKYISFSFCKKII